MQSNSKYSTKRLQQSDAEFHAAIDAAIVQAGLNPADIERMNQLLKEAKKDVDAEWKTVDKDALRKGVRPTLPMFKRYEALKDRMHQHRIPY
jgi:hypothetical protein